MNEYQGSNPAEVENITGNIRTALQFFAYDTFFVFPWCYQMQAILDMR